MPSGDPCWSSDDASIAGAVLGQLLVGDARVRRCLDLAAGAAQ